MIGSCSITSAWMADLRHYGRVGRGACWILITLVAFLGKISGVFVGGRMAGMSSRQALAVGCGLNARGILGIVMAAAAFDAGLIDLRLFVACVLMCVITTMAAGPALGLILGPHRARPEPS